MSIQFGRNIGHAVVHIYGTAVPTIFMMVSRMVNRNNLSSMAVCSKLLFFSADNNNLLRMASGIQASITDAVSFSRSSFPFNASECTKAKMAVTILATAFTPDNVKLVTGIRTYKGTQFPFECIVFMRQAGHRSSEFPSIMLAASNHSGRNGSCSFRRWRDAGI